MKRENSILKNLKRNKKTVSSPVRKTNRCFACLVTCLDIKNAERIAQILVREKLASCVNILGPVKSVYRWGGKICKGREVLLIIKGTFANQVKMTLKIRSLHSYEVPEIIFFKIDSGLDKYLSWLITNK